ncbi:MAG: hypothetical protein ABIQ88_09930 [Chitinophagaceae bacterium]
MKKLALLLLAILALTITGSYYLIPDKLAVTEIVKVNRVAEAVYRNLSNEGTWRKWWPGLTGEDTAAVSGKFFAINNRRYSLSKKMTNNFEILIESENGNTPSEMNLFPIGRDSAIIKWHFSIDAGSNPFKRIAAYTKALSLKKDMHRILSSAESYLSGFKNVYGFSLHEASIADTLLISTKTVSPVWPGTDFIYARINKLKNFCSTGGCRITGTPMLNITPIQPRGFQVMLALPVDRIVQPKDSVYSVKMVPGKFIITDVVGGTYAITQTYQQIHNYFQDYRRTVMAIPFEYLITDRQQETDTSKWVTRIYAPVY